MTPAEHEGLLLRILERLGAIETRIGAVEKEGALHREDTRLIRQELREQHSILVGLLGHTPPGGVRVAEVG